MSTHRKPSVHVRLPVELITALTERAREQGMSLNSFLAMTLAHAVEWTPANKKARDVAASGPVAAHEDDDEQRAAG
jgi:hypothetical protein